MNVNELLDTIEDTLEESTSMPLSGGKRLVDVEKVRDYLDDIRANLPGELRQAQQIVNDRAQIVDTANAQAQAIVKKAEERARILVSDAEIVKAAQQRAAEITAAAQSESRTLRQTVTDYCDNMLKTTEDSRIAHLARIGKSLWLICLANLIIGVVNITDGQTFSIVNLLCSVLLAYGLGRIHGMKASLEEERALHE